MQLVSKSFVITTLLFVAFVTASPLYGQTVGESWRFPQETKDCNSANWPISQQIQGLRERRNQCQTDEWRRRVDGTSDKGPALYDHRCKPANTYGQAGYKECSSVLNSLCEMRSTQVSKAEMCRHNLRVFRERKKEEERRRKEDERLAAERQRYYEEQARQAALANNNRAQQANENRLKALEKRQQRDAAEDSRLAKFISDRYGKFGSGPANLAGDTYRLGSVVGQVATGRSLPLNSSLRLSAGISALGSRFIARQHEQALSQFNNAMSEFDASNPRPTRSQREEYITGAGNQFVNQFDEHADRINQSEQAQSLSPQSSLVVGVGAELITEIVRMRNDGEISESLGNVTTVFAHIATAVLVYRIEKEKKKKAALDDQLLADARAQSESLQQQRQALLYDARKPIRDELERKQKRLEGEKEAKESERQLKEFISRSHQMINRIMLEEDLRQERQRQERQRQRQVPSSSFESVDRGPTQEAPRAESQNRMQRLRTQRSLAWRQRMYDDQAQDSTLLG